MQNQKQLADGWRFDVKTAEGTTHTVTVDRDYYDELASDSTSVEDLAKESFRFLLEREPASAILPEFNLKDIATYFPEYPKKITNRL
ncbi:MAG: hypothetical protein BRC25_01310 [Parcubacteria group bacterium SW_6_46_9]|nr:MAG: hypothetical protein BRC25_01310 [Parcubacteria group bacterium SW_6_46_9]